MNCARLLTATLIAVMLPVSAMAGETVDSIFAKMDKVTNGYDDSMMSVLMTVHDVDGSKKTYEYDVFQKGQKRMIKFTSGEVKGMVNLVISPSEVYVYLPSQKKIRRVASHKMGQSLAGSDMTSDDAAFTSWPEAFTPELEKEDANYWYVKATGKKGSPYASSRLKIAKDGYLLAEYKFYNDKGELVKTYSCTDVRDWGGGLRRAKLITITDGKTKHKTTLDLRKFKVNLGYKDSMFSKRELEWGR